MGVADTGTESPIPRRPIGSGRAGRVRAAVRVALEDARPRLTPALEVTALLAERYADLVDRAARIGDEAGLMRAGDKLATLLEKLPLRAGVSSGDGGTGDGAGDGESRGLHVVIDGPPTMGDAAHS